MIHYPYKLLVKKVFQQRKIYIKQNYYKILNRKKNKLKKFKYKYKIIYIKITLYKVICVILKNLFH